VAYFLSNTVGKLLWLIIIKSYLNSHLWLDFFISFDYKMSTRIWQVCIKYSMCDLICDVITCCVWSCDAGKINVSDKIVSKPVKKRKYGNKIKFLYKFPSKWSFWHRTDSSLRRADARGSTDIIYRIWRISLVCGSCIVRLLKTESRSRIEHLIPTNNITVLVIHTLIWRINIYLIDRL